MGTGVGVGGGVGLTVGVKDAVGLGGRGVAIDVAVAAGRIIDALVSAGGALSVAGGVADGTAARRVGVGDGLGNGLLVGLPAAWDATVTVAEARSAPQPSSVSASSSKRAAASSALPRWRDLPKVSCCLLPSTLLDPGPKWVVNRNITRIKITFQYKSCQR
jgi:hypothetical protein